MARLFCLPRAFASCDFETKICLAGYHPKRQLIRLCKRFSHTFKPEGFFLTTKAVFSTLAGLEITNRKKPNNK